MVALVSFGLGYAVRFVHNTPQVTRDKTSRSHYRATGDAEPRSDDEKPSLRETTRPREVTKRKEVSRPFAPGQSREWLTAQIRHGGWKDDPATFFRMIQEYSAMDEPEISEMVETLLHIIRDRQAGDPAVAASFPKEWLFKYGIFPAMFRFSQLNPGAALDVIEGDPLLKESDAYQVAFSNLTAMSPELALARAKGLEGAALRNAMEPILGTLFASDPDRVIQILGDFPQPEFDGERRKVAERLALEDPKRAVEYAVSAVNAGHQPDVLQAVVAIWMQSDPAAAKQWAASYYGPEAGELKK